MKLTTIVRELSDRVRLARNVTGLTGGTSGVDGLTVTGVGTGYANSFAVTFAGGGGAGAAGTATAIGGTDVESSPNVIRPDDYVAGTNEKVWKIATVG